MNEAEPVGVEGLAAEDDRSQRGGAINVSLFPDERVPPKAGLESNLVALACHERNFDEGRVAKGFEDPIPRHGILPFRVPRMRFLLYERPPIPDQPVTPGSRGRRRVAVDNRKIYALWVVPGELVFQPSLRIGPKREEDEA